MHIFKSIGILILVFLANFLFWRLGGVPVLILGISLAVAGPGNRILWFFLFALFVALAFAISSFDVSHLALGNNIVIAILAVGLLPLCPAMLIWSAHSLRARRRIVKKQCLAA